MAIKIDKPIKITRLVNKLGSYNIFIKIFVPLLYSKAINYLFYLAALEIVSATLQSMID